MDVDEGSPDDYRSLMTYIECAINFHTFLIVLVYLIPVLLFFVKIRRVFVCAFNFHTAVGYTVSQLDVSLHPRPWGSVTNRMIKPHGVDVVRWGDFFQSPRE